jgi:glycosyltransferase involved in cell wall biosynthesis
MGFNFVFIIPSYNNKDWYEYNIKSIAKQKYDNWRVIYIDDHSTDNTLKLVKDYVKNLGLTKKFTYLQNPKKIGPAGSRYQGYMNTNDDEICCMLDGDDWLYGDSVLNILNTEYDAGYNCTYGSYLSTGTNMSRPRKDFRNIVHRQKSYRNTMSNSASHLRTMKSQLINSINPSHYLQIDNQWIQVGTDMAEMFYVLEQENSRPKYIDKPIYVYNTNNSIRYNTSYYHYVDNINGVNDAICNSEMRVYREKVNDFIKNAR